MRKTVLVIIASLFLLVSVGSCTTFSYAQSTEFPQDKNGNLELHVVVNENVDIEVFIDNKLAVNEQFHKTQEDDFIIPPQKVFKFNLAPGKHVLRAQAYQGKQSFTGEVEINNKRWVYLHYVDPQQTKKKEPFSLEIYDYQIMYQ